MKKAGQGSWRCGGSRVSNARRQAGCPRRVERRPEVAQGLKAAEVFCRRGG